MPRQVSEYRCLIISPGDVQEERDAATDVINGWNATVGSGLGVRVEPVRWETHTHPEMGGRAQSIVNRQAVDGCELGIAIFWSRLGSPTGEFDSGSDEEIERIGASGGRVLVYQSSRSLPSDADLEQVKRLRAKISDYRTRGLLGEYSSIEDLRSQISKDLSLVFQDLVAGDVVQTAPRPDIRVRMQRAIVGGTRVRDDIATVTAENHSQHNFHLQSFRLKLKDGQTIFFKADSVTGELNSHRRVEPGDSCAFMISRRHLVNGDFEPSDIVCALVVDKIGRFFPSDPEEAKKVIESLIASEGTAG